MEAIMAIGVGYVFMLTPAIIVFWCCVPSRTVLKSDWTSSYRCREFPVRSSVWTVEVCQSFINLWGLVIYEAGASFLSPQRWEYVAINKVISLLGGGEPLLLTSVIIGALGLGVLLTDRLSSRSGVTESTAAPNQTVS